MTHDDTKLFLDGFDLMQSAVNENSEKHGFWTKDQSHPGLKIALIHSELSEALEAMRGGDIQDHHLPHRKNAEVELADAVIRIMDLAHHLGYDLSGAILEKHAFNCTRPFKHGKVF